MVDYQMLVSWPSPHGQDMPLSRNALETSVFQPAFQKRSRTGLHATFSGGREKKFIEMFGSVLAGDGIVWGPAFQVEIDVLDPSAWFGMPSKYID